MNAQPTNDTAASAGVGGTRGRGGADGGGEEASGAPTAKLVRGHSLRHEGAPYAHGPDGWQRVSRYSGYASTGGSGHAMCSCGATSEQLHSGGDRKRWHRAHKAEVSQ